MAEQGYDRTIRRVYLEDTLSNLFLLVHSYRYVILKDDDNNYILTRPSAWGWATKPDILAMRLGRSQLEPDAMTFHTIDQALTYLDLCT